MKYECPSCKMEWEDDIEPLDRRSCPTCIFCSGKHTQKELLNWQIDHLESISPKNFHLVFRHFYRYVESKLNIIVEKINEEDSR